MLKSFRNGWIRLIAQLRNWNTIAVSNAHYNLPSIASQGEKHCKDVFHYEVRRRICERNRRKYL